MSQAVSFGQITITDLTDIGSLSVYPTANQPLTVIYNPDQNTYTPNWASSNLTLTPVIYYGGKELKYGDSGVTITWKRQVGSSSPAALTTGETVTNGVLKVTANKFTATSTMLSYIVTVDYNDSEYGIALKAEGKITFSLVKQATAAKTAAITGGQLFKYDYAKAIVGASSITLTGTITGNISISQWQYQNESGSWVKYPNSTTASTLTVNDTDSTFFDDKCVIRLMTSDANVFDLHTITKLYDGANGNSTVSAVLTNEDQMLPADSTGEITSYADAKTELRIYKGGADDTSSWTIALSKTGTITYQVSTDGTNWQASTETGNWTHVRVTAMSSDTASITFKATKEKDTVIKTYSLVRIKTGADGKDAVVYTVDTSSVAVNATSGNNVTFTPSSVTVTAYSKTGTSNRAVYKSGRFKIYAGGTSGTVLYSSTADESTGTHTITSSNLTDALSAGFITVQLYSSGGSTLLDTQTIVITTDGATGEQGPQGKAGTDAINVILGNQADVIPCTSVNKTIAKTDIVIPFSGYKGTTRVECKVANPGKLFGEDPKIVKDGSATADGNITWSIPAETSISAASGTVTLTFTCEGKTIVMYYRWTRSTASENAVYLQLLTPQGTVFTNGSGSLTIEGKLYNGTTDASASTTWAWAKFENGNYTTISGQTSRTITISGTTVNGFASYRCTATFGGKNYISYVSLIDKTDPLQVEVLSSIGDQIVNGIGVGAFYVIARQNGVEVDPIKSTRFLTTAPTGASAGDYYYHLDSTNKTVTLKKYSGSAWANAPSGELPTGTYTWAHMDKDGKTISKTGLATSGKVIYIDGTFFDKKMVSTVEVKIS